MRHAERLKKNLLASIAAKQEFLGKSEQIEIFAKVVDVVVDRYRKGGSFYIAGNGGSAADAQHLAAEFVSKLAKDRAPLPAEALTVDSSILTAIGNDYGYDEVFARQIAGEMRAEDIFLGITTSGKSRNILRALEQCKAMGITTVIFCGRNGSPAKALADHCILACGKETSTIQEQHIVFAHTLCECVEVAFFGD